MFSIAPAAGVHQQHLQQTAFTNGKRSSTSTKQTAIVSETSHPVSSPTTASSVSPSTIPSNPIAASASPSSSLSPCPTSPSSTSPSDDLSQTRTQRGASVGLTQAAIEAEMLAAAAVSKTPQSPAPSAAALASLVHKRLSGIQMAGAGGGISGFVPIRATTNTGLMQSPPIAGEAQFTRVGSFTQPATAQKPASVLSLSTPLVALPPPSSPTPVPLSPATVSSPMIAPSSVPPTAVDSKRFSASSTILSPASTSVASPSSPAPSPALKIPSASSPSLAPLPPTAAGTSMIPSIASSSSKGIASPLSSSSPSPSSSSSSPSSSPSSSSDPTDPLYICICSGSNFLLSGSSFDPERGVSCGALTASATWTLLTSPRSKKYKLFRDYRGLYLACGFSNNNGAAAAGGGGSSIAPSLSGFVYLSPTPDLSCEWLVSHGQVQYFSTRHHSFFLTVLPSPHSSLPLVTVLPPPKSPASQFRICFAIIQGYLKMKKTEKGSLSSPGNGQTNGSPTGGGTAGSGGGGGANGSGGSGGCASGGQTSSNGGGGGGGGGLGKIVESVVAGVGGGAGKRRFFWCSPQDFAYWKNEEEVQTQDAQGKIPYAHMIAIQYCPDKHPNAFTITVATPNSSSGTSTASSSSSSTNVNGGSGGSNSPRSSGLLKHLRLEASNRYEVEMWLSALKGKGVKVLISASGMESPPMNGTPSNRSPSNSQEERR